MELYTIKTTDRYYFYEKLKWGYNNNNNKLFPSLIYIYIYIYIYVYVCAYIFEDPMREKCKYSKIKIFTYGIVFKLLIFLQHVFLTFYVIIRK